jgi:hypothetical protein
MNFQYPKFGSGDDGDRLRFRGDRFETAVSGLGVTAAPRPPLKPGHRAEQRMHSVFTRVRRETGKRSRWCKSTTMKE